MSNPETHFRRVLEAAGLAPGEIIMDGALHRCPVADRPQGQDGAYIAHADEPATIWWQNFRTGQCDTWTAKTDKEMSQAEREALKRRIDKDRAAREKAQAELHAKRANLAKYILKKAPPCPADHGYLVKKDVSSLGGVGLARDGRLIVPVLDESGQVQSLQFIPTEGKKLFLTGGKASGGYFPIKAQGEATGPLYIAEGYATGATIHQATRATVLCVFSSNNLKAVAEMARRKYPDREIIICADDDLTEGNPGLSKATEAAGAINGKLAVPSFLDHGGKSDFNDMAREQDHEAVKTALANAQAPELPQDAPKAIEAVSPALDEWEPSTPKPWPVLSQAALPGLVSDFVGLATANSEADPAAVLTTFLVRFACEAGGPDPATRPHLYIGDSRHEPRLFAVVAGKSSKARKGTSAEPVRRLFGLGDVDLPMATTSPGPLSSGEGLVYQVRDELRTWEADKKTGTGLWVVKDPGISDKRLFVCDEELAAGLRCTKREGNTLSTALRGAWDNGTIHPLTKSTPTKTTQAHICIVAHITLEELSRALDEVELFNGFANRFLWTLARRTALVSRPKPMPARELAALQSVLLDRLRFAHTAGLMEMAADGYGMWDEVYPSLSVDRGGLFGAVVGRAEAQVQRLAMVYALLDGKPVITANHLQAALSFWNYAEASAAYIFEGKQTDPVREKILAALRAASGPLTTTELHRALGNNATQEQFKAALDALTSAGLVTHEKLRAEGAKKPKNLFRLNEINELYEFNPKGVGITSLNSLNSPASKENHADPEKWDGPAEVEI